MFRFRSMAPASLVLVALIAACSGAGSSPAPTTAPATAAPSAAPATATAPTLAFTVSLAPAGFFVSSNGMALYTFDKDTLGQSNCQTGQCATNWPALVLQGGVQLAIGAGLNASDFATISRDDGTKQVTFKEIPLYNFAGDTAIGDTKGDGVGGIWHLATKASTLPVPSTAPSTAPTTAPTTPASAPASPAASSGGKICYDEYNTVIPCPSGSPAGSPAAGGPTVAVSTDGYLVSSTGLALYEYDKDTTANTSACTADCATNWPALTVTEGAVVTVGDGVDLEDFTTFTRSDDSTSQVSYYGKPLYMFSGDAAAGDTNGANVSPSWHLAMPQ